MSFQQIESGRPISPNKKKPLPINYEFSKFNYNCNTKSGSLDEFYERHSNFN